MSEILLLGMSHKTAPVEPRECIAFSADETTIALETLQKHPDISEVLLFSTCNRVELLVVTTNRPNADGAVTRFLSESKQVPAALLEESLYIHSGDEAVRHVGVSGAGARTDALGVVAPAASVVSPAMPAPRWAMPPGPVEADLSTLAVRRCLRGTLRRR